MRRVLISALLLGLSVALVMPSLASETSLNISTSGTLKYSTVILSDEFERTQLVDGKLTGWPEHYIIEPQYIGFSTEQARSGVRSLVVTSPATYPNTRVYMRRTEKEFWMSQWLYFPNDFHLTNWFSFGNPVYEWIADGTALFFELQLLKGDELRFYLVKYKKTNYEPESGSPAYYDSGINIPRGQWVNIKCHVIRDPNNGVIDIYVDEQLKIHYTGETLWQQEHFNVIIVKHYCAYDPPDLLKTVYFDDLELWTVA